MVDLRPSTWSAAPDDHPILEARAPETLHTKAPMNGEAAHLPLEELEEQGILSAYDVSKL